jgi:membrane-associated phospholipid phosphatase
MLRYFASTESLFRFLVWAILCLIALVDFVALKAMGIKLVIDSDYSFIIKLILVFMAFSLFLHKIAKNALKDGFKKFALGFKTLACFLEFSAQFFVFIGSFVILSYIAASSSRPIYDSELFAIDKFLGFDWLAYILWVNKYPEVNDIMKTAYHSAFQVAFIFVILSFTQRYARLYSFMLCLILSVIIVIGISAIFPATGYYNFLHINMGDYPHLYGAPGYVHIKDLYGMRSGELAALNLSELKGIISFPSFHAAMAVTMAWAFWGIIWVAVPFLLLNVIMLTAIPVSGGHYLIDVIAGAFIAIGVICLVKYITKYADTKFETINNNFSGERI